MSTLVYVLMAIAALVAGFFLVRFARQYYRLRGTRLVSCPENGEAVAVEVDGRRAALGATFGSPVFELTECTRWPERQDCGRQCLAQISEAPIDCLVRTKLAAWYADKSCAFCGKTIGAIDWHEHRPALVGAERVTLAWQDIQPERLGEVLATHEAVCWSCHVIETFRRTHPDRVIDNPWRPSRA